MQEAPDAVVGEHLVGGVRREDEVGLATGVDVAVGGAASAHGAPVVCEEAEVRQEDEVGASREYDGSYTAVRTSIEHGCKMRRRWSKRRFGRGALVSGDARGH